MVDVHFAPVVHVEHLKVDKSRKQSHNSRSMQNGSLHCASAPPPPMRSTRDLSMTVSNDNYNNSDLPETKFDSVDMTGVTRKNFASENYQERLAKYSSSMGSNRDLSSRDPDSDEIVQLLAWQVYHLPGNSWWKDWWQYMANNHPVFGVCFHHKLHPIGSKTRIVALIGTVVFGLALTNMFYLFYLWNPEFDRVVMTFVTRSGDEIVLTTGMLLLWTLGGGVHCTFNLAMWHVAACACCRPGGFCETYACCPSLGKHMIRVFVLVILILFIMIVLLRVAINNHKDSLNDEDLLNTEADNGIDIRIDDALDLDVHSASEFSFLIGYLVEMALTFFVYFPIGGTMLFSGMMACWCKIPILGGRPYEIYCEENQNARRSGASSVLRSRGGGNLEKGSIPNRESFEVSVT